MSTDGPATADRPTPGPDTGRPGTEPPATERPRAPKRRRAAPARRSPSVLRILQADYLSGLCVIAPLVGWGLFVAVEVLGLSPGRRGAASAGAPRGHVLLYVALVATAVCVPLLLARLRSFFATFRAGVEVTGRVLSVSFYRDRGTIEFAFEHEGREHAVSRGVHKTARTAALEAGDEVAVLLDPRAPQAALIRDLFV
ncbi:MAG: DUF3592 domain-containing protein [Planctomycetota bacterium]